LPKSTADPAASVGMTSLLNQTGDLPFGNFKTCDGEMGEGAKRTFFAPSIVSSKSSLSERMAGTGLAVASADSLTELVPLLILSMKKMAALSPCNHPPPAGLRC